MKTDCIFKKIKNGTTHFVHPLELEKMACEFLKTELILDKYCCPQFKTIRDYEDFIFSLNKNGDIHESTFLAESHALNTSVSKVLDRAYRITSSSLFPSLQEIRKALKEDAFMTINDLETSSYMSFCGHMYKNEYYLVYNSKYV